MKTHLIIPTLTFFAASPLAIFAAEADVKVAPPAQTKSSSVFVQSKSGGGGKATITIDVNGKKETREIDLGNGTEIKVGDGGAVTVTSKSEKTKEPRERKTWLGISSDEVPDEVRAQIAIDEGTGLLVRGVVAGSPAAKAGLEKSDVLLKFDEQLLTNPNQLRALIGTKKEGETVRLTYLRRGHETTVEVKLEGREGGEGKDDLGGLNVSNLLNKNWPVEIKKFAGPLQFQSRAVVLDKDGNVITKQGASGLNETVEQLERTLRDAGVEKEVVEQTKRALAEVGEALKKAGGDANAARSEVTKEIQSAMQEMKQAVSEVRKAAEAARREAEEVARKAKQTPPVEKAP